MVRSMRALWLAAVSALLSSGNVLAQPKISGAEYSAPALTNTEFLITLYLNWTDASLPPNGARRVCSIAMLFRTQSAE